MDPRMIGEIGGDLLFTKITRPHKALMVNFGPSLFKTIDKGSLIICDNILLKTLQHTVTRAVEDGTFHRCGVVLLMTSTEECTFVRAVSESPTAQEAVARWSPTTTPPKKLKRLNTKSAQAPKEQTSSLGGPRGGSRGGFRGKRRGRGGYRGWRGDRGRGGYRGGHRGPSRGRTIVQSGIHYHTW